MKKYLNNARLVSVILISSILFGIVPQKVFANKEKNDDIQINLEGLNISSVTVNDEELELDKVVNEKGIIINNDFKKGTKNHIKVNGFYDTLGKKDSQIQMDNKFSNKNTVKVNSLVEEKVNDTTQLKSVKAHEEVIYTIKGKEINKNYQIIKKIDENFVVDNIKTNLNYIEKDNEIVFDVNKSEIPNIEIKGYFKFIQPTNENPNTNIYNIHSKSTILINNKEYSINDTVINEVDMNDIDTSYEVIIRANGVELDRQTVKGKTGQKNAPHYLNDLNAVQSDIEYRDVVYSDDINKYIILLENPQSEDSLSIDATKNKRDLHYTECSINGNLFIKYVDEEGYDIAPRRNRIGKLLGPEFLTAWKRDVEGYEIIHGLDENGDEPVIFGNYNQVKEHVYIYRKIDDSPSLTPIIPGIEAPNKEESTDVILPETPASNNITIESQNTINLFEDIEYNIFIEIEDDEQPLPIQPIQNVEYYIKHIDEDGKDIIPVITKKDILGKKVRITPSDKINLNQYELISNNMIETNIKKDMVITFEYKHKKHLPYIKGYPDQTVRPNNNITREEVAVIFNRTFDLVKEIEYNNHFKDLDNNRWSYNDVVKNIEGNILKGYYDGELKPQRDITRAEAITMLIRYTGLDITNNVKNDVSDFNKHWAKEYIQAAIDNDLIVGYEEGVFKPEQKITRAEFVTMMNRYLERKCNLDDLSSHFIDLQKTNDWYYKDMIEASIIHKIK